MPSFSLKWMLAGVAAAALGCVALLHASPAWAAVTYAGALLLLLTAPVCIIYRRGARRAFWVGAAVFGWGCFVLMAGGFYRTNLGIVPTSTVLGYVFENIPKRDGPVVTLKQQGGDLVATTTATGTVPTLINFSRTGQPLFIILITYIGGGVGRFVYATRDKCEL